MASRFGNRDTRRSLFSAYDAQTSHAHPKAPTNHSLSNDYPAAASAASSHQSKAGHVHTLEQQSRPNSNSSFGAYPSGGGPSGSEGYRSGAITSGSGFGQFRTATPNSKGQYSDAVLNELESQNDEELEGMSAKVRMLKEITVAIGDEIRDSTKLAESMNSTFENTRVKLKGTMNRMLRMAEKTGVGWKVWLLFFLAVILLFCYVRYL